jgi:hypothetical protein
MDDSESPSARGVRSQPMTDVRAALGLIAGDVDELLTQRRNDDREDH